MSRIGLNAARGETMIDIGGMPYRLCLTLGALAEIETALDCEDLGALNTKLSRLSAGNLLLVLAALLRGGGEDKAAARLPDTVVDIGVAASAIADCFKRAGA